VCLLAGAYGPEVSETEITAAYSAWWLGLGILSSIGLGTGMHSGLLFLFPHMLKVRVLVVAVSRIFTHLPENVGLCHKGLVHYMCVPVCVCMCWMCVRVHVRTSVCRHARMRSPDLQADIISWNVSWPEKECDDRTSIPYPREELLCKVSL
jgi:hypothetical protein